jgi:hypothetical protein
MFYFEYIRRNIQTHQYGLHLTKTTYFPPPNFPLSLRANFSRHIKTLLFWNRNVFLIFLAFFVSLDKFSLDIKQPFSKCTQKYCTNSRSLVIRLNVCAVQFKLYRHDSSVHAQYFKDGCVSFALILSFLDWYLSSFWAPTRIGYAAFPMRYVTWQI